MSKHLISVGAVIAAALLSSCGGSGSGMTSAQQPTPPQAVYSNVSLVPVGAASPSSWGPEVTWTTQLGETFQIAGGAHVTVDGVPLSVTDLSIGSGETVLLSGSATETSPGIDSMTAYVVEIDHVLDGPIDAIDRQHTRLVVLGITVEIRPGTYFNLDGSDQLFSDSTIDLTELKPGDRLIVSGAPSAGGQVIASRIARSSSASGLAEGFVSAVDQAQKKFTIGSLVIDYAGAELQGFGNAAPQPGQHVRVHGAETQDPEALSATSVVALPEDIAGNVGDHVTLFGLVTKAAPAPSAFPQLVQVDGFEVSVQMSSTADYCGPPILDSLVVLQGIRGTDGRVSAQFACSFSEWTRATITGPISSIDPTFNTITVLGFPVQATLATFLVPSSNPPYTAPPLHVGDVVEAIGGRAAMDGAMLAVSLQSVAATKGQSISVDVVGGLLRLDAPTAYVMGRPITVTPETTYIGLGPMTMQDFFTQPLPIHYFDCVNYLIFTVTDGPGGGLTATSIELHPDFGSC